MTLVYPAIFHREDDTFWVEFPDLEGCHTYGNTINEAMECAQEALFGYLISVMESGIEIPLPSECKEIECDADSFVTLVSCCINNYGNKRAVKKTLTIPAWLNERAEALNINFSQLLQDALLARIMQRDTRTF